VNVRGVFLCLKHQIPLMLQNADGPGAIVITSSTAGEVSQLGFRFRQGDMCESNSV
jgi:NAD(P)-dependent dehydrogenase (short-subunit alcohol dehydrogenase family)